MQCAQATGRSTHKRAPLVELRDPTTTVEMDTIGLALRAPARAPQTRRPVPVSTAVASRVNSGLIMSRSRAQRARVERTTPAHLVCMIGFGIDVPDPLVCAREGFYRSSSVWCDGTTTSDTQTCTRESCSTRSRAPGPPVVDCTRAPACAFGTSYNCSTRTLRRSLCVLTSRHRRWLIPHRRSVHRPHFVGPPDMRHMFQRHPVQLWTWHVPHGNTVHWQLEHGYPRLRRQVLVHPAI